MKRRNFIKAVAGTVAAVALPVAIAAPVEKEWILVVAVVEGSGPVLRELFETWDDANEFCKHKLDQQLRDHYSDMMADDKSLIVSSGPIGLFKG